MACLLLCFWGVQSTFWKVFLGRRFWSCPSKEKLPNEVGRGLHFSLANTPIKELHAELTSTLGPFSLLPALRSLCFCEMAERERDRERKRKDHSGAQHANEQTMLRKRKFKSHLLYSKQVASKPLWSWYKNESHLLPAMKTKNILYFLPHISNFCVVFIFKRVLFFLEFSV